MATHIHSALSLDLETETEVSGVVATRRGFEITNESHGDVRCTLTVVASATVGKLLHPGESWRIMGAEGIDFVAAGPHVSLVTGTLNVYPLGNADPALGRDALAAAAVQLYEMRT